MPMHQHVCLQCSTPFLDKRPVAKFCSHACYSQSLVRHVSHPCETCGTMTANAKYCSVTCHTPHKRRFKTCAICGKAFPPQDRENKYCSLDCYKQSRIPTRKRQCDHCGETYEPRPERARKGFCTHACYRLSRGLSAIPVPLPETTCLICHTTFKAKRRTGKRLRMYCSWKCANIAKRTWRYGMKRTQHFTPQQKRRIRARDGHRCVKCGDSRAIQVDHIIPVALGGPSRIDNGQTLCLVCHNLKSNQDKQDIRKHRKTSRA